MNTFKKTLMTRTDEQLDRFTAEHCRPEFAGDMEIFFAREGMQVAI